MSLVRLIVSDTSPLVTLAMADVLPALVGPNIPIGIPNAVYVEATRVETAASASAIVEWMNSNVEGFRNART